MTSSELHWQTRSWLQQGKTTGSVLDGNASNPWILGHTRMWEQQCWHGISNCFFRGQAVINLLLQILGTGRVERWCDVCWAWDIWGHRTEGRQVELKEGFVSGRWAWKTFSRGGFVGNDGVENLSACIRSLQHDFREAGCKDLPRVVVEAIQQAAVGSLLIGCGGDVLYQRARTKVPCSHKSQSLDPHDSGARHTL